MTQTYNYLTKYVLCINLFLRTTTDREIPFDNSQHFNFKTVDFGKNILYLFIHVLKHVFSNHYSLLHCAKSICFGMKSFSKVVVATKTHWNIFIYTCCCVYFLLCIFTFFICKSLMAVELNWMMVFFCFVAVHLHISLCLYLFYSWSINGGSVW